MKYRIILPFIGLMCSSAFAMEENLGDQLVIAARDDNYEQVKEYLDAGVDPDAPCTMVWMKGITGLQAAANGGHEKIVELFLKRGAKPNITYEPAITESGLDLGELILPCFRSSALNYACERGHIQVAKLLLSQGADPSWFNGVGHTPLNNAVAKGHIEVVGLLLEHSAPVNFISRINHSYGSTDFTGFSFSSTSGTKFSPLYTAVKMGRKDIVKTLLKHGADVVNTGSPTQLLAVAYTRGDEDLITMLHNAGAPLTFISPKMLVKACKQSNDSGAQLLAQSGIDLEEKDEEHKATPLIWAANNGLFELCELLVLSGAHIATQNNKKLTALDCARIMRLKTAIKLAEYMTTTEEPLLSECIDNFRKIKNFPRIIALLEKYQNTPLPLLYKSMSESRKLLRKGTLTQDDLAHIGGIDAVKPFGLEHVLEFDKDAAQEFEDAQRKTEVIDFSLMFP